MEADFHKVLTSLKWALNSMEVRKILDLKNPKLQGLKISHFFFVDDALLFFNAIHKACENLET